MITQGVLNKLLTNKSNIVKLCEAKGYKHLRLFEPEDVKDCLRLNFVIEPPKDNRHSLLEVINLQEELIELLQVDVRLITDDMLRNRNIKKIPYYKADREKITEFFSRLLALSDKVQAFYSKNKSPSLFRESYSADDKESSPLIKRKKLADDLVKLKNVIEEMPATCSQEQIDNTLIQCLLSHITPETLLDRIYDKGDKKLAMQHDELNKNVKSIG